LRHQKCKFVSNYYKYKDKTLDPYHDSVGIICNTKLLLSTKTIKSWLQYLYNDRKKEKFMTSFTNQLNSSTKSKILTTAKIVIIFFASLAVFAFAA